MNMKQKIEAQIPHGIYAEIAKMEAESSLKKQKRMAEKIVRKLDDIDDFHPYSFQDDEGYTYIALRYIYSVGIQESIMSHRHDVMIGSEGVHIEDEGIFNDRRESCKNE